VIDDRGIRGGHCIIGTREGSGTCVILVGEDEECDSAGVNCILVDRVGFTTVEFGE
jgi:hypothetical protein